MLHTSSPTLIQPTPMREKDGDDDGEGDWVDTPSTVPVEEQCGLRDQTAVEQVSLIAIKVIATKMGAVV